MGYRYPLAVFPHGKPSCQDALARLLSSGLGEPEAIIVCKKSNAAANAVSKPHLCGLLLRYWRQ